MRWTLRRVVLSAAVAVLGGTVLDGLGVATAQTVGATARGAPVSGAGTMVPDFVDSRPLPPIERARSSGIDAKRQADDAAQRAADARRRADEDAQRMSATAERQRRADEDAKRAAADAETKRQAEVEAKRLADAETKRLAEAASAKAQAALDAKRTADAAKEAETRAAALRQAATEAAQKADIEAKRQAAAAEASQKAAAEAETKRRADDATRIAAEAEATRRADEAPRSAASIDKAKAEASGGTLSAATPASVTAPAIPAALASTAGVSAVLPTARPEGQRYLNRGRDLLKTGDITAARTFFERAMRFGAAEGAVELGGTYDPVVLRQLGVVGLRPDPIRANQLYTQARQWGVADADERLRRLQAGR